MKQQYPLALADVLTSELDDEIVILCVQSGRASTLNGSAAAVWQACDGKSDLDTLAEKASAALDVTVDTNFVRTALDGLADSGLLENADEYAEYLAVLSRRRALRVVGLTAAVAIPFIATVAVPSAAHAASDGSNTSDTTESVAGSSGSSTSTTAAP